jgi:glycosyltransferase involved in cell wall biosynthesis
MCQQRDISGFAFVDGEADLDKDNAGYIIRETGRPSAAGSCVIVRPDIGGLLPVYVYDDYAGFTVKRYVDLTDEELETYVSRNVTAMRTVIRSLQPDAVITGHEVMGPYIAKLACATTGDGFVAKLHGSALEYAVKVQDRYLRFAEEGLGAAHHVVGGSRYMLDAASKTIPGWRDKATVVNPGVDIDLFKPDPLRSAGSRVGFVGKLIAEKGIHEFLLALGDTESPGLEVIVVGYGGDEDPIRQLWSALQSRDRNAARDVLSSLALSERSIEWLDDASDEVLERFRDIPMEFTGRLEHGPLSKLLPTFDVLVVPSIVPEAFGMVAAEAAACGVLPIVPDHSGIAEAGEAVEEKIGMPGLLTFDHTRPITPMANAIDRVLALAPEDRKRMGALASELASTRWSWIYVGESLLAAAV